MEVQDKPVSHWYEVGVLLLAILDVYLSFSAGRFLGFEGAELTGYAMGPVLAALTIVGIAQVMRRARTRRARSKIAFFTLLVFFFGTFSSFMQARVKLTQTLVEIDPESLTVDEATAFSLASRIQDAVSRGQPNDLQLLYDADRFVTKALRGQDTKSRDVREVARGGSEAFAHSRILEQMQSMVEQGGEFNFVKLYKREQEPILQFRLTEASGNLHYLDLYIFKTGEGKLKIDDLRYYNSGEPLSKQVMSSAASLDRKSSGIQSLENAVKLAQQGKAQEAYEILNSLPDDLAHQRIVIRLRLQLAYQVNPHHAEELLNEFKARFPDDPSIIFLAFAGAISKDDLDNAADLIGDIAEAVGGDEYLLWYKVNLFITEAEFQKAIGTLSEMETKYKINVTSMAETKLPVEFRSSRVYLAWAKQH